MTIPRQLPRVFAFGLLLGLVSTFASAANPFGPVQLLTTAGTDRGLFLRDMDGDGNLDLITTSTTQVQIHYGTTTGYTQTPTVVSPVLQAGWSIQAASTFDIATAPLNADSYVDLIVYSASSDNIKDPSRKAQVDNFLAGSARGFQKLFATVFNEATNLEQIYPHSTHLGIADLYFKFTNRLEFYFLFDPLTGTFKSRPVKSAVPKGKFEEFLINGSPQIILKNEGSKKKFSRIYIFASMADRQG